MKILVVKLIAGIIAAGISAALLLPAVYAYRGYHAVGGEWFLIIAIGCLAFSLIGPKRKEVKK